MMDQILSFFIPSAYADSMTGPGAQQGGSFSFLMMALVMVAFLYFAVWRPQNKRAKEQQALLESLAKGDEIVTIGGVLGKIAKIGDQYLTITVANNIEIAIQKSSVATVLPKGTLKSIE